MLHTGDIFDASLCFGVEIDHRFVARIFQDWQCDFGGKDIVEIEAGRHALHPDETFHE